MALRQDECELSIKKTGEVLGRVRLVYETYESGELSDSSGYLDGISMALAGTLAQRLTLLTLRRADGRTAVVTITEVLPDDRAGVLFDHAPFSEPPHEKG